MMAWEKICEAKKRLTIYEKVANWDDSAGEDAFKNAKTRYWATINGLPCHIPLPDPDAYIDVVDHDAVIYNQQDSFYSFREGQERRFATVYSRWQEERRMRLLQK